jgi:predicted metalloprotease
MRWKDDDQRRSDNVEDRRGVSPGGIAVGGGVGTLIIIVIAWLLGVDPRPLLQQMPNNAPPPPNAAAPGPRGAPGVPGQVGANPAEEELKDFVRVVLADTEDVWQALFRKMDRPYQKPTLVLFRDEVDSACGSASSAVGPFYCPGDEKVYLDLAFFEELTRRFKAPGEFAEAYVIAHEIGHHVQNLMGISRKVDGMRRRSSEKEANALSVRLELQADFLAGVWAHHAQKMKRIIEPGDIESALRAATAIGDDNIQRHARGYVVPDAFTHGSSEQRVRWFRKGFETGDIRAGDTFNAERL